MVPPVDTRALTYLVSRRRPSQSYKNIWRRRRKREEVVVQSEEGERDARDFS